MSYVDLQSLPALSLGVAVVADVAVFFGLYLTLTPLVRAITTNGQDLIEVTLSEPAFVRKVTSPIHKIREIPRKATQSIVSLGRVSRHRSPSVLSPGKRRA